MTRSTPRLLGLALLFAAMAHAAAPDKPKPADLEKLMAQYRTACITLDYHLKYDRIEEPYGRGYRCPNCGGYHGSDMTEHVTHQYPLRVPGYLVDDRTVVSASLHIPARFIAKVVASAGGAETAATLDGWSATEDAVRFSLAEPLPGTTPLAFVDGAETVRQIAFSFEDGLTQLNVAPLDEKSVWYEELRRAFREGLPSALCLDAQDRAVALSIRSTVALEESYRNPNRWDWLSADEMAQTFARIEQTARSGVFAVRLNFRVERSRERRRAYRYDSDSSEAPEQHEVGLLVAPDTLAIVVPLSPERLATLTGLTATTQDGKEVVGTFAGQLRDYSILMARFEGIGGTPLAFDDGEPSRNLHRTVIGVAPRAVNNRLFLSSGTSVLESFERGYKGHLEPEVPLRMSSPAMVFDLEGKVVAVPCALTAPTARSRYSSATTLLNGRLAHAIFAAPATYLNPANTPSPDGRPLPPPWFGAELQALTAEIAAERHLDIPPRSDEGALVSSVAPGSPAAQAGLRKDDILLLWGPDSACQVPIEIEDEGRYGGGESFPWQELDEVPDQYFEHIPSPWPSPRNTLVDRMAAIGVGGTLHLTWQRGEQVMTAAVPIVQGRPTYETAPKHRDRTLGLTVKPMTDEVRRYLKLDENAPGVVVSAITPGSKASVAGIKPYELVTKVNDAPVATLDAFAEAVKASPDEVRLTVNRIGKDRIVKMKKAANGGAKKADGETPTAQGGAAPAQDAEEDAEEVDGAEAAEDAGAVDP